MGERVTWADAARGLAIIAVVVFHAAMNLRYVDAAGVWRPIVLLLETFRMPAFFFVSGLFAVNILSRPTRTTWARRIGFFAYLYLLWAVIQVVSFAAIRNDLNVGTWAELWPLPIDPHHSLWFLYALALYTAFVWALRGAPAWVPLALSATVSFLFLSEAVLAGPIDELSNAWMKTGGYIFFFVLGIYARSWTFNRAARLTTGSGIVVIAAYVVAAVVWLGTPLDEIPITRGLVSFLGVAAGVSLAVLLARTKKFRWLEYLGRNTLPIYVIHLIPIMATLQVFRVTGAELDTLGKLIATPLLSIASILISLAIFHLLRRVPGLFDAPWHRTTSRPQPENIKPERV